MIEKTIPFLLLALFACSKSDPDPGPDPEPGPAPGEVVTYGNESLVAIDPAGRLRSTTVIRRCVTKK